MIKGLIRRIKTNNDKRAESRAQKNIERLKYLDHEESKINFRLNNLDLDEDTELAYRKELHKIKKLRKKSYPNSLKQSHLMTHLVK